jgi:hypothetical protein
MVSVACKTHWSLTYNTQTLHTRNLPAVGAHNGLLNDRTHAGSAMSLIVALPSRSCSLLVEQ